MACSIKNTAELEVFACEGEHTFCSNEVEAQVIYVRLIKTQSKSCVFVGDYLDYTIKICNDSSQNLIHSIFCDNLPGDLEYVIGSFKVDGHDKTPVWHPSDNRISYKIDEIKAGHVVTITFCVKVL